MDSWNELELKPPPTLTCKVAPAQVSFSDLRKISDTCWNALTLLKNQETLCSEAAILSRLIHRMRFMFRGDKGFKSIQKVHQCLRNFLALNLIPIYESFFRTIPWDCSDKELFCPTRQMLEYVLLRTQGFAALLCRIVHTCLEAASLLKGRMSSGHNWQVSLLCLGAVSRIWSISKALLNSSIEWYDKMLPYLSKFQPKGPLWLSEDYVFPSNITQWLSLPWMATPDSLNESHMDFEDQDYENVNESANEDVSSFAGHINPKIMSIRDDVGESISRSSVPVVAAAKTSQDSSKSRITAKASEKNKPKLSDDVGESIKRSTIPIVAAIATTTQEGSKYKPIVKPQEKLKQKKKTKDLKNDVANSPIKQIKKKANKTINIMSVISSIESQNDVEQFLNRETDKRSLTCSLGEEQWLLLKNLVTKLNVKLKKLKDENKRQKLLEQIRKALQIALT